MNDSMNERMIDRWFPVAAVDEACGTPAGSGKNEKSIFTWFASRPIAQARAAVLGSVLPDEDHLHDLVNKAILTGSQESLEELHTEALRSGTTTVLDCFSGRGIIPLEASRLGLKSMGIDLSPVATLAGRLLADWPLRDWSHEPLIPFEVRPEGSEEGEDDAGVLPMEVQPGSSESRLLADLRIVFAEIQSRVADRVEPWYPRNTAGDFPWAYLWTTTVPCDGCRRRFPLLGNLALRHPSTKQGDAGQSLEVVAKSDGEWAVEVVEGSPSSTPTFVAASGTRGKSARCPFCSHLHTLDAIKAKGPQYEDEPIAAVDLVHVDVPSGRRGGGTKSIERKVFRSLDDAERKAALATGWDEDPFGSLTAIPNERIPEGSTHTIRAYGYGFRDFGSLMCRRQALHFAATAHVIRGCYQDLIRAGVSAEYAACLAAYASANLARKLRYSTRGCRLQARGNSSGSETNGIAAGDVFVNQSTISFGFDFIETGPGRGPSTWASMANTLLTPLRGHVSGLPDFGIPGRFQVASATSLPLRDRSVDYVVTDPPYYSMIQYGDASDLMYVWLRRCLFDILPDLFGEAASDDGLQDASQEIIVSDRTGVDDHRDEDWYESQLSAAFGEMRRVLKADGHLVVVFGHSDPDAWRRLLGALHAAGFVVTSAWPSRTETGSTGVASIRVTVSIGCRVAPSKRPPGIAAEVDREVADAVADRIAQWDADGLALEDQLMASYGPAMEVYGRYSSVLNPDGSEADLDRYLTIARKSVRDAMRLRVDELPLETFDVITRFSVFWLRAKGRTEVPKGEARFFAQADELRLEDLRGRILTESRAGFRLTLEAPPAVSEHSSTFEVVRAMAHAWDSGGTEAVAEVMALGRRDTDDRHLWAVVGELANTLPASDGVAKALAGIRRTSSTISTLVGSLRESHDQASLFDEEE